MGNKNAIIDALGEVRENLILNKYNDAMMLMAQITIDVIEHLTDESLLVSKGYEEDLKTLESMGIIGSDTVHNFDTLIISGVQAHNGVEIPKEHAEKALEVLSNEIDILFKQSDKKETKVVGGDTNNYYEYNEEELYKGDFSKDIGAENGAPAFMQGDDDDFREKERMRQNILTAEKRKVSRNKIKLIAIIIPIIFVLLVVFAVKAMFFSGPKNTAKKIKEIEVLESSTEATTEIETSETLPPEAGYYDVTGNLVKVRNAATKEGSKVLGSVNKGDKVLVKSFYNTDWAIIIFEGREAYISRNYIKKDESLTPVFEESAAPIEETN